MAVESPYPGFDNLPTPRTNEVDIPGNWDQPDKLANLCRELEREVTLADMSYADLCKKVKATGNYTADREQDPTAVTFANGRTVTIKDGHLVIGWAQPLPKRVDGG